RRTRTTECRASRPSRSCRRHEGAAPFEPHVGLLPGEHLEALARRGPRAFLTNGPLLAPRSEPLVEIHLLRKAWIRREDHRPTELPQVADDVAPVPREDAELRLH